MIILDYPLLSSNTGLIIRMMPNDGVIDPCSDEFPKPVTQANRQKHSSDVINLCSDDDDNQECPKDDDPILNPDDVPDERRVNLKRLKRREPPKKNDYRNPDFAFNKEDDEDIYTDTSESSYSSDADDEARRALALNNHRLSLYNAFKHLQTGNYHKFLTSDVIQHEFRPVETVIESCGRGDGVRDTRNLWFLAWKNNELDIKKLERAERKQKCISCGLSRDLIYVVLQNNEYGCVQLGHMGRGCYDRFSTLINLRNVCRLIAMTLMTNGWDNLSPEFDEYVIDELQEAIDMVNGAPEQMANFEWFGHN